MKRFLERYGHILAVFAIIIARGAAGFVCPFVYHQPAMPEAVRKLRNF